VAAGVAPFLGRMIAEGTAWRADSVVPTFTNPNNLSIVCGVPPSIRHLRQLLLGRDRRRRPRRRSDDERSVLPARRHAARGGVRRRRVAVVTAKDKLRRLLGWRMNGICFSAEKAAQANLAENGIVDVLDWVGLPSPDVYSAALSEFVFAAGVRLAQTRQVDLMYLSTTDYVQHKCEPGSAGANAFYAMMDRYLAQLDALGWAIGPRPTTG
jgi:phosphonoacetate hydrolase